MPHKVSGHPYLGFKLLHASRITSRELGNEPALFYTVFYLPKYICITMSASTKYAFELEVSWLVLEVLHPAGYDCSGIRRAYLSLKCSSYDRYQVVNESLEYYGLRFHGKQSWHYQSSTKNSGSFDTNQCSPSATGRNMVPIPLFQYRFLVLLNRIR